MPVKNAAPYLKECVESVLNQTHQKWELIALDDHSTDESFDILKAYSSDKIRVEQNRGEGIISALQQAFHSSNGQYISRMDADDLMPENKLELLLEAHKSGQVTTGQVRYFSENSVSEGYQRYEHWLNELLTHEDYRSAIYRECVIASPNWLIDRSFFDQFDWDKWIYPEDYDLVFHWLAAGYRIHSVDEVTHLWREHPRRTSRNSDIYQQASFFKLKTKWFVRNELSGNKVQLIGSQQKAKLVEQELTSMNINVLKFDKELKEGILPLHELNSDLMTVLTNWPSDKKVQQEIKDYLAELGFEFGKNLWLF